MLKHLNHNPYYDQQIYFTSLLSSFSFLITRSSCIHTFFKLDSSQKIKLVLFLVIKVFITGLQIVQRRPININSKANFATLPCKFPLQAVHCFESLYLHRLGRVFHRIFTLPNLSIIHLCFYIEALVGFIYHSNVLVYWITKTLLQN